MKEINSTLKTLKTLECTQCKKIFLSLSDTKLCSLCEKISEAGLNQEMKNELESIMNLYGDLGAKSQGKIKNFKIEDN